MPSSPAIRFLPISVEDSSAVCVRVTADSITPGPDTAADSAERNSGQPTFSSASRGFHIFCQVAIGVRFLFFKTMLTQIANPNYHSASQTEFNLTSIIPLSSPLHSRSGKHRTSFHSERRNITSPGLDFCAVAMFTISAFLSPTLLTS